MSGTRLEIPFVDGEGWEGRFRRKQPRQGLEEDPGSSFFLSSIARYLPIFYRAPPIYLSIYHLLLLGYLAQFAMALHRFGSASFLACLLTN
ncbi:hypothetical protein P280DRAFT_116055 [Massarina eburnea CBS 473.64]|uniref:Uncharacterized protein n=1 Tax=Massarina eburnea CBS 473.64 TaxID=1395130 RepID=A0A6A6SDC9_9PLEO|nr:hypothetical protein P280DRAFT_116055 [Massarina eburnea CBS 473.64]